MNCSSNKTSESNKNNIIKNSDCKNVIRDHSGEGCRHTTRHAKQEATENPEVTLEKAEQITNSLVDDMPLTCDNSMHD
ncbi:hypothetical protein BGAL_0012g00550 [Botrytis galanthina]|uniref:Uncharacterized protein n=1 Tax=Botrytis galanthina TaxID=278940 RepID=A0A4S8RN81_9HELO|nr:hypothetical protein BGAL_0012g00550 [Botrytis galanthina]